MKLLLRLVSPAAMLGAVLSAVPATNTAPVVAQRLSAADANVFFGYYDLKERRGRELGAFAALPAPVTDIRCDLHPRWLPDGRISFDSTHEGFRGLYLIDPKR